MDAARFEELVDAWMDGRITPGELAAVQDALREDGTARRRFWQRMRLHRQIGDLLREADGAAAARPQAQPVRRPRPVRQRVRLVHLVLACAAALVAAVGWWQLTAVHVPTLAVVVSVGPGTHATVGGLDVVADQPVPALADLIVDRGEVVLGWTGEATSLTLAGGSRLRLDAGAGGKRIVLDHGSLRLKAARQPDGAALLVMTPRSLATITSAECRFAVDADSTFLAVEAGEVNLSRVGSPDTIRCPAGMQACDLPDAPIAMYALPKHEVALTVQALPLHDPDSSMVIGSGPGIGGAAAITCRQRLGRAGWALCGLTAPDGRGWDLRGSDGISFWLKGTGSGRILSVELLGVDDPAVADSWERHWTGLVDGRTDWHLVALPWSTFVRRDWQPEGAPRHGFDVARVHGLNLGLQDQESASFAIVGLTAWTGSPALPPPPAILPR